MQDDPDHHGGYAPDFYPDNLAIRKRMLSLPHPALGAVSKGPLAVMASLKCARFTRVLGGNYSNFLHI